MDDLETKRAEWREFNALDGTNLTNPFHILEHPDSIALPATEDGRRIAAIAVGNYVTEDKISALLTYAERLRDAGCEVASCMAVRSMHRKYRNTVTNGPHYRQWVNWYLSVKAMFICPDEIGPPKKTLDCRKKENV